MDSLDPATLRELYLYVRKNSAVKRKRPEPKKVNVQYAQEDSVKRISELEGKLQKFDTASSHGMLACEDIFDGYCMLSRCN